MAFALYVTAYGQFDDKKVTIDSISNQDGLTLGKGFSFDSYTTSNSTPFIFDYAKQPPPSFRKTIGPKTKIEMYATTESKAQEMVSGFDLETELRTPFFKLEASLIKKAKLDLNADNYHFVLVGEHYYGDDEIVNPNAILDPAAKDMIDKKMMDAFVKQYGTHYVSSEHRYSHIFLDITVDRWSQQTIDSIRAEMKAEGGFIVSAKVRIAIQNDLKNAAKREAVSVKAYLGGGIGFPAMDEMAKTVFRGTANIDDLGNAIGAMLKTFTRENSKVHKVTLTPYTSIGWKPAGLSLWNKLLDDKLKECAELYYDGWKTRNRIKDVMKKVEISTHDKLAPYVGKYDNYLRALAAFQVRLIDKKDQKAVEEKFPEEPKFDQDTIRALLGKYQSLEWAAGVQIWKTGNEGVPITAGAHGTKLVKMDDIPENAKVFLTTRAVGNTSAPIDNLSSNGGGLGPLYTATCQIRQGNNDGTNGLLLIVTDTANGARNATVHVDYMIVVPTK